MAPVWRTPSEISEALARYESGLGWRRPRLHGIGFTDDPNEIGFVRVNENEDLLAAAVLATVTGWRGTTGSVRLGKSKLAKAIKRLTPAEACPEADHANLRIRREIHSWYWAGPYVRGGSLVAVFDSGPDVPSDDPYVTALREVVTSGRQSTPADDVHRWPPPDGRHPLQDSWEARWPHLPPIGHALRADEDHWVRFHSLPEAKRYAETPSEYETILRRHNTVLEELGAQTPNLQVITLELAFSPVPRRRNPVVEDLLPDAECWLVMSWPDLDPTLAFAHAYVSRLGWQPGRRNELLRKIADDEIANVIIAPPDLTWLYAPYDGGADVLLSTQAYVSACETGIANGYRTAPAVSNCRQCIEAVSGRTVMPLICETTHLFGVSDGEDTAAGPVSEPGYHSAPSRRPGTHAWGQRRAAPTTDSKERLGDRSAPTSSTSADVRASWTPTSNGLTAQSSSMYPVVGSTMARKPRMFSMCSWSDQFRVGLAPNP